MREDFEVKIYGVRGSLQAVGINGGSFGANTSCVLVRCGDTRIVLDCGSGAFILGEELLNEPENDLTVLISHTHLDHILGVPFFRPLFESRFSISFYGAVQCGRNIIEQIGCMMSPPLWPVGVSDFKASVVHREVVPGKGFTLENGIIVETLL